MTYKEAEVQFIKMNLYPNSTLDERKTREGRSIIDFTTGRG